MTDEQRTDTLRVYGSPWARMPAVDSLARDGVVFLNAITPAPVCAPARASLLTGLYPHQHGIWHNIPPAEYPELPLLTEGFHAAGYRSASFGKRHYSASNQAFQTESNFEVSELVDWFDYKQGHNRQEYGAIQYPPHPYAWLLGGRFPGSAEETSEARVVREAKQWLEEHDGSQPFLLRLSFNAPHTPVTPPPPFDSLFADIPYPAEAEGTREAEPQWLRESLRAFQDANRLSQKQIQVARRYYYGFAAFLDSQIEQCLSWMRGQGLLRNTIIAFVSDHGTHIGDYGLVQKQTFYDPVVKVPYFFWAPERLRPRVITNPVETRTLLPTLLELAGLNAPTGTSLATVMRGETQPTTSKVFSEFTLGTFGVRKSDRLVMVQEGPWRCSLCAEAPDDGALFNLAEDPWERINLFHHSASRAQRDRLVACLVEHLAQTIT